MPHQTAALPDELQQLSKKLDQWRGANPPRARLPESLWSAAVEMAQRHGLHRTAKTLRLDYMRLKKRMPGPVTPAGPVPSAFLELLAPAATVAAECVVEWESARGRMRVAMKGVTPDWASLLRAWRES